MAAVEMFLKLYIQTLSHFLRRDYANIVLMAMKLQGFIK